MVRGIYELVNFDFANYIPVRCYITGVVDAIPHFHEELEIYYVMLGSAEIQINNQKQLLREDQFALINPMEIHSLKTTSPCFPLVIQIGKDVQSFFKTEEQNDLANFPCFDPRYKNKTTVFFEYIKEIMKLMLNGGKYYEVNIYGIILQMMAFNYNKFNDPEGKRKENKHKKIDKVIEKIVYEISNDNIQQMTLESLAAKLHFSTSHLAHLFKDCFGTSFGQYMRMVKISKSKNMLMSTEKAISEIALECGFESINTFERVFKDVVECTPTEFRNRITNYSSSKKHYLTGLLKDGEPYYLSKTGVYVKEDEFIIKNILRDSITRLTVSGIKDLS